MKTQNSEASYKAALRSSAQPSPISFQVSFNLLFQLESCFSVIGERLSKRSLCQSNYGTILRPMAVM